MGIILPKKACAAEPQVGQASWYGGFHHGRKMANGKPFNMYANTVAHRTLPLGTVVQVINRSNGRSVTATVTDRGPYAKRRVLDVSRGIANNKLAIVLNDVKDRNISHYDKKYGYGYYSDDYKSKKVNKIFKRISKFTK
jgi:rare lipoprotein A